MPKWIAISSALDDRASRAMGTGSMRTTLGNERSTWLLPFEIGQYDLYDEVEGSRERRLKGLYVPMEGEV